MSVVDHIAVLVDDLDEALDWWQERLGAAVTHRDEFYYRLSVNNTNIALISKNKYPSAHIGILCDSYHELPKEGTKVEHRDGTVGVYQEDPSGNVVEFIWYNKECREKFLNEES
tara:strand:+ start:1246 stop:1587 length:342 start_codon:yes stop_codon:yes gene_type:complete